MKLPETHLDEWSTQFSDWLTSPAFYAQLAAIGTAVVCAMAISALLKLRVAELRGAPGPGPMLPLRQFLFGMGSLLLPILFALLLGVAIEIGTAWIGRVWLVRLAQSMAVVWLFYLVISRFVEYSFVRNLLKWVGIPLATLQVFGWLDDVTSYLDGVSIHVGTLEVSLYDLGRTAFFGVILFWLGRISNSAGKAAIRNQPDLDIGTREVVAKLFEISLYVVIFLVLLQVMGIPLATLAVFGGAMGLGFGLQRIAATFVSGIIILMDRSITLDDYIELEDGRAGRLRELNMRCATLETFDGKDIVVPNETFISTAFTNWTHNNKKQRYQVRFSVAYDTDLPAMIRVVADIVRSHPKVLSGPDMPAAEQTDVEIESFGDSAINILVEFWMEGIDDGENSVDADLRLMIWAALKEHNIEMPFPQREIRLLGAKGTLAQAAGAASQHDIPGVDSPSWGS